jgi:hypothetical protein
VLRSEYGGGASGIDLTDAVTVFVTTIGAPTYEACLEHLRAQDCHFTLRVIDRVAPMSAAFQRMLDECRTPYYVQVDEDMLLHPYAVRTLYERIERAGPQAVLVVAELFDAHLARGILGVKIFRHAVARRYPFSSLDTFETDQVKQMEADGHVVVRDRPGVEPVAGQTLGLHGTSWTLPLIYERYMKLERRRLTTGLKRDWLAPYGAEFLERFRRDPSAENFFALMGIVAGVLSSRDGPASAKDYRTYGAQPGFAALEQFLTALAPPAESDAADAPPADAAGARRP